MTGYLVAEIEFMGGGDARRQCSADLDQVLLHRDAEKIDAFLNRWGEGLRDLLNNFADIATEDAIDRGLLEEEDEAA